MTVTSTWPTSWCAWRAAGSSPSWHRPDPAGASLLAIAVDQSPSMVNEIPPSRAGSLPPLFLLTGRHLGDPLATVSSF
ncbi:hypothetical protein FJD35_21720 [Pseudomonas mandelii]|nr:hypothetical protein FJD35_21720 [Pseudomonas mandelii]